MKNLIEIEPKGKIVFVGDIHGDLEAVETIFSSYLKPGYIIVFLGDYVDRGEHSRECVELILNKKKQYPGKIFALLGNHEACMKCPCYPASFWNNLTDKEKDKYGKLFEKFPLVVSCGNIIALHGALPEVKSLREIDNIDNANWRAITWGDFTEENIEKDYPLTGRPLFGPRYFNRIMKTLNKRILIRSHQPHISQVIFNKSCITLFTSKAYGSKRTIAIADFSKKIESADDLKIVDI